MRVRIDIGLDLDGLHTFTWQPSAHEQAIELPHSTLERWSAEREAFTRAKLRWQNVIEEIEDALYRQEQQKPVIVNSSAVNPRTVKAVSR